MRVLRVLCFVSVMSFLTPLHAEEQKVTDVDQVSEATEASAEEAPPEGHMVGLFSRIRERMRQRAAPCVSASPCISASPCGAVSAPACEAVATTCQPACATVCETVCSPAVVCAPVCVPQVICPPVVIAPRSSYPSADAEKHLTTESVSKEDSLLASL